MKSKPKNPFLAFAEPGFEQEIDAALAEANGDVDKAAHQASMAAERLTGSESQRQAKVAAVLDASRPDQRVGAFLALCKRVLGKAFPDHELALSRRYASKIRGMSSEAFALKLDEFRRSLTGTPKGELVMQRRAAANNNSAVAKLERFLDQLFS